MTFTDWLLDIALISLVLLQLRDRVLSLHTLLLPAALVTWAGFRYLGAVPTAGNDLEFVGLAVAAGLALGTGAGVLTRVRRRHEDGRVVVRATYTAAALWVLGMAARLAFQLYVTHGGAPAVGRFSVEHHLDRASWTTAILLMAFAEVFSRTGVLWWRSLAVRRVPQGRIAAA
ncbi:hypothetical protein [Streptacidiphilus monticola]|uniref:DUF1453 domain-containing protein n=1 Tax=Streptacidiphilus monticola TaxID=2161674 RepID=A0ABW1FZA7_9ACTN